MKKSIAMKWAKALASGKYKQAQGELRGKKGYCCLGVLCDLVRDEAGLTAEGDYGFRSSGGHYHNGCPPQQVLDVTGLKSDVGALTYGRKRKDTALTDLNDSGNLSFKKIANIIRRRYKDL